MPDCFGKQIFETLRRRVQIAQKGRKSDEPMRPVWFSPHEAKFCSSSGAVVVEEHKTTGDRRVTFNQCAYPKCNCDHIKQWYAKDYQNSEVVDGDNLQRS